MPPAARVTDLHVCPMVTPGVPPIPHVGGPILPPGVPNVLIDFLPAATVTDMATCVGPPDVIVMGSVGVFINFLPAARLGDPTAHGGVITLGSPTCIIGEVGAGSPGAAGLAGIVAGLAATGVNNPTAPEPSAYTTPDGFWDVVKAWLGLAPAPYGKLLQISKGVNPQGGTINCGNIVDAVIDRITGSNPNAVAPTTQDGTFEAIGQRHDTQIVWGKTFQSAFDTVKTGGDGTIAIIGIRSPTIVHVVVMANDNGEVGIVEGQAGGMVITDSEAANKLYNQNGKSDIGYGIVPKSGS